MNTELHSQLVAACERYVVLNNFDAGISKLNEQKKNLIAEYEREKKKGVGAGKSIAIILVFSIIICSFAMVLLCMLFVYALGNKYATTGATPNMLEISLVFSPFLLIAVPFILVFSYKKVVVKKKEKKRKLELDNYCQNVFMPQRDKISSAIRNLENEKRTFINNTRTVLDFMPEHYRTNLAVAFLERVIRTGRADTLKEGLNLFEEQLYRWRMEGYAKQMQEQRAIESAMIDEHLSRISANQGRIASSLQNLEALEFYNTFCK